ncbi:ParB-like protein [Bdellovibrio sp. HCB2-146]|uniref:ParB-like protein n=1 Tax=Bdellovibrio sp. HCB2-146 TaxID=3394362 RepID=UPI0039BCDF5D
MKAFFLSFAAICLLTVSAQAVELVQIANLHPTQSSVGMKAVEVKKKEIEKQTPEEFANFLREETVPVVIGPNGEKYLIDNHHQSRALLDSGKSEVYIEVEADWSKLSPKKFWKLMEQKKYVYLRDAEGNKIKPEALPAKISEMTDDPYRSLAYFARKAKAYKKSKIPFSEFKWAEYYRTHIPLTDIQGDWDAALKKAIEISSLPAAKELPGYQEAKK